MSRMEHERFPIKPFEGTKMTPIGRTHPETSRFLKMSNGLNLPMKPLVLCRAVYARKVAIFKLAAEFFCLVEGPDVVLFVDDFVKIFI